MYPQELSISFYGAVFGQPQYGVFNFNKKDSHFSVALRLNFYLLRAFSLSQESYTNCAYQALTWVAENGWLPESYYKYEHLDSAKQDVMKAGSLFNCFCG